MSVTRAGAAVLRLREEARPRHHHEAVRVAEALLFASPDPLDPTTVAARLPPDSDVALVLDDLARLYASRGVNLVRVAGGWAFRTAPDLAFVLAKEPAAAQKLSRAATEVLAIIAYHQPATRADIEEVRGVATSRGTLDILMEAGWVRLRGRRRAPGRPVTYGTTPAFLDHFGLNAIGDLPGLEELKGLGLIEGRLPAGLSLPAPSDDVGLRDDEDPLDVDGSEPERGGSA